MLLDIKRIFVEKEHIISKDGTEVPMLLCMWLHIIIIAIGIQYYASLLETFA